MCDYYLQFKDKNAPPNKPSERTSSIDDASAIRMCVGCFKNIDFHVYVC